MRLDEDTDLGLRLDQAGVEVVFSEDAFTSITAALNSLTGPPPPEGESDYIGLLGNCTENVTITVPLLRRPMAS